MGPRSPPMRIIARTPRTNSRARGLMEHKKKILVVWVVSPGGAAISAPPEVSCRHLERFVKGGLVAGLASPQIQGGMLTSGVGVGRV